MKPINKIIITFILVLSFGLQGCYEEFANDFDYSAVYFGAQKPLRTIVTRVDQPELVFKIGVALSGVRENTSGYDIEYELAPDLLTTVEGANKLKLLPSYCYTIENSNNFTFHIPKGKIIGDCQVRINKNAFVNLQGSLGAKYAIPLRLLSTTADTILDVKNYTVLVVKYIDEHSGNYYVQGSQRQLDEDVDYQTPAGTITTYNKSDLSQNDVRSFITLSMTEFEMGGLGAFAPSNTENAKIILLNDGKVAISQATGGNEITDMECTYIATEKVFNLQYKFKKRFEIKNAQGQVTKVFFINFECIEKLTLRQDVEKELRFEEWN